MRVSFESGRETTSLWAGSPPKNNRQQPTPRLVAVVVSLMQKPCGVAVVASAPEPGCCCLGGMAYWLTPITLLVRLSEGEAKFSEAVFLSVQTTNWLDV